MSEIEEIKLKIKVIEEKIDEIVKAYNRHRHRFLLSGDSGYPTYPIKKKWRAEKPCV